MTKQTSRRKQAAKQPEQFSPSKRRLFAAITLFLPFFLLAALEGGLRLFAYGPDLSLFTTETLAAKTYYTMNPDVKNRYFSRFAFNPSTSPDYFLMPKPKGVYRIFCLGGSTTVGYPYWYNGAFSTFLRDRLRALFPERTIEIINIGMTATNSFTVLDMARDAVRYEPDLFLVYDGHNEFYGALGVASNESIGRFRFLTTLYLRLVHFKTFLLAREAYGRLRGFVSGGENSLRSGTMMEKLAHGKTIPYQSPLYEDGLAAFRANLAGLKELCAGHGIPVVVGTQVSNVRDRAPFVSNFSPETPPEGQASFEEQYRTGLALMTQGSFDSAHAAFLKAFSIDSFRADVQYALARSLDSLGRTGEARTAYRRARDYDELRFRMSTGFNNELRRQCDGTTMLLADVERTFEAHSPDSIVGNRLITEHLHPNSYGYFLMASAYAGTMRSLGALAPEPEWKKRDTIRNEKLWEERKVTELDELLAERRTDILTSGWPFKADVPVVESVSPADTLAQIVEQVTRAKWTWNQAHEAAAEYYYRRAEYDKAEREYHIIIDQMPVVDVQMYLKLARTLLDQGKKGEMRDVLLRSLTIAPTLLAYRALGDIARESGLWEDAATYYEGMFTLPQSKQEQVENGYLLALVYIRGEHKAKAEAQVMKVLTLRPDYQPAVDLLVQLKTGE